MKSVKCILTLLLLLIPVISSAFTIKIINNTDKEKGCAIEYYDYSIYYKAVTVAYTTLLPKESVIVDRSNTFGRYFIIWYTKDKYDLVSGHQKQFIADKNTYKIITEAKDEKIIIIKKEDI